jgi:integrase
LPISEDLTSEFQWVFEDRQNQWVFTNPRTGKPYVDPRKWYKNLCDRAKVRNLGFHALRRYVASIMDDKHKVSKKAIQNLLRHKKESTTERYLQMIHSDLSDYAGLAIPETNLHQAFTPNKKGINGENR